MARPRYLLDTNIVSALARDPQGSIARRIAAVGAERIAVSIVACCEIRFGIAKGVSRRLGERLERLLEVIEQLPFEAPADEHYADIRAQLERAGTPIGANDLLIAAQARALDLVVVTDNGAEFSRVPGLSVENWLRD